MKKTTKKAVLLKLMKSLRQHGSWCGETHVQKAVYFLQQATKVPAEFDFILYKHGPFSFDLCEELTLMQADGLLEVINQYHYGASISVSKRGESFLKLFPKTVSKFENKIEYIAEDFGKKGVAELERLSTALYVTGEEEHQGFIDRANLLNKLKPHIPVQSAMEAVKEIDQIVKKAPNV